MPGQLVCPVSEGARERSDPKESRTSLLSHSAAMEQRVEATESIR